MGSKDRGPAVPTTGYPTWGGIARSLWVLLAGDRDRIKTEMPHLRVREIPAVQQAYRFVVAVFALMVLAFAVGLAKSTDDWALLLGYWIGIALCVPVAITTVWLYVRHDERKRLREEKSE
jgi:hypothetical protein